MKLNWKIIHLLLAMVMYCVVCPTCVTAEEKERTKGDSLLDKQTDSNQITCYESAKHLVVAKEVRGRVGTDFLVKYKSKPGEKLACSYGFHKDYFEVRNEWAEYFFWVEE